jgi:5-methylcytosine-specific restriction protein A
MKRLRSAPPRIGAAPSRLASTATSGTGFVRHDGRSSTQRGYGADWRRVRAQVLAAEPLCRFCAASGRVEPAVEVDHVEPFHGLDDPRRLAVTNLRPLCTPCHRARTARQAAQGPDARAGGTQRNGATSLRGGGGV